PGLLRPRGRIAGSLEVVADGAVDLTPGHTRPHHRNRKLERLARQPMQLAKLIGRIADDECAGHVGEARRVAVPRPETTTDRLASMDRARPHVVADRARRTAGDDELVRRHAVTEELVFHPLLDELHRELLAPYRKRPVARLGAPEHVDACAHT